MMKIVLKPYKKIGLMIVVFVAALLLMACTNAKEITISFVTNDTVTKPNITLKSGYKLSQTDLEIHERQHFDFNGWYIDEELTIVFDLDSTMNQSLTLYAKWTEHEKTSYTIKHLLHVDTDTFELYDEEVVEDTYVGTEVQIDALQIDNYTATNDSLTVTI